MTSERKKETYNFLEWSPTKIYLIKMNDFWINVSYITGKPIVNMITYPAIEFEWIAIEVFESLRGGKGAVSVILKLDLLWFEGSYLIFGTFDFFVFWRG